MKDYKKINEILDRYWQCETSVEEEKMLQNFFLSSTNIPSYLLQYQSLFEYREAKQAEKLPDDFDEKILKQIHPKRKRISLFRTIQVAASIALLVGLGLTAHVHHVRAEQAQARETVLDALFMISDNLQQGEQMILRGLEDFIIP
jgi:hypothetical protein